MVNKVILLGNVGSTPDIRMLPSGGRVANFMLVTSESWKDKDNVRREKTEWHKIVVFSEAIIRIVENYINKGSKLYIEGTIRTHRYTDPSGQERSATEIHLQSYNDILRMLDIRTSYKTKEESQEDDGSF